MTLLDWQRSHNEIIPPAPLSIDEIRERRTRNVIGVAYDGDVLVGCSTVRPPSDETSAAVVIAQVLPAYRRRGFGTVIYQHCLARGQELGDGIETHILSSNTGWLRFAKAHGFVEVETYLLPCCGLLRVRRSRQHRPRLLPPGRHPQPYPARPADPYLTAQVSNLNCGYE